MCMGVCSLGALSLVVAMFPTQDIRQWSTQRQKDFTFDVDLWGRILSPSTSLRLNEIILSDNKSGLNLGPRDIKAVSLYGLSR